MGGGGEGGGAAGGGGGTPLPSSPCGARLTCQPLRGYEQLLMNHLGGKRRGQDVVLNPPPLCARVHVGGGRWWARIPTRHRPAPPPRPQPQPHAHISKQPARPSTPPHPPSPPHTPAPTLGGPIAQQPRCSVEGVVCLEPRAPGQRAVGLGPPHHLHIQLQRAVQALGPLRVCLVGWGGVGFPPPPPPHTPATHPPAHAPPTLTLNPSVSPSMRRCTAV